MINYYDNTTGELVETVNENHYHSWLSTERRIKGILECKDAKGYWERGEYFEAYIKCPIILYVLEKAEYLPEDVFYAHGDMEYAHGFERVKTPWGGVAFI